MLRLVCLFGKKNELWNSDKIRNLRGKTQSYNNSNLVGLKLSYSLLVGLRIFAGPTTEERERVSAFS